MDEKKTDKKKILQKYLFYLAVFTVFGFVMWWIFSPTGAGTKEEQKGYNTEIPDPHENIIIGDKREAFTREEYHKENYPRQTVEDYIKKSPEAEPVGQGIQQQTAGDPVSVSYEALGQVNHSLQSFYETYDNSPSEQELLALEWRIQELEKKLEEEPATSTMEQQLMLLEKSYEMAARYMPQAEPEEKGFSSTDSPAKEPEEEHPVHIAARVPEETVSALDQYIENGEFLEKAGQPRNLGFYTVGRTASRLPRNTIQACIYEDQTLTSGQQVRILLREPLQIEAYTIPRNTLLTGTAMISQERLQIQIASIQHEGLLLPVSLSAHDLDGSPGIHVPGTMEMDAVKEVIAASGTSVGGSVSINRDAKGQILADLSRGAIQGTAGLFAKKVREIKVHVKAGHTILLSLQS